MSIATRQSELFAGQTWQVLYKAFNSVNFNASDPASINAALRNYIQSNYPEDFNDWIESSEFVAILDLLAWLAGNLAFKTDISVRENFLETAEARTSILRLARFLSYAPSRNLAATGIVKLMQVSTNDDVTDSYGTDLANTTILWNDPNNFNWYEQFTSILNNAFSTTNPFGVPLKSGTVANVAAQLYRVNGLFNAQSPTFSATVSGQAMAFEICNGDFTDGGNLFERSPNTANAFNFYYLNDGNGNDSSQTGFFLLFKQGNTQTSTTIISQPVQNQLIAISSTGVNQTDVWVQTVDDNGLDLIDWVQVPAVLSANTTYNDISATERNIFSIVNGDNDTISIRFSDGNFGNAPVGNLQTTYRVSNGLSYTIKPQEISLVRLPFQYLNPTGVQKTLYLTFSLQDSVSNAAATESIEQIRQRAPLVYATQNRMVSGEDYNTYPLSSNLAVKINAVNRVYSGHSRYIDLNDPTGTYQDLSIIGEDGILFSEEADTYTEVPLSLNRSAIDVINDTIQPMLLLDSAATAVNDVLIQAILAGTLMPPAGMIWTAATTGVNPTTGSFSVASPLVQVGALLQISNSVGASLYWVGVAAVNGPINVANSLNAAGPVTLSFAIPTGATVVAIRPRYNATLPQALIGQMTTLLTQQYGFTLAYDYAYVDPLTQGVGEFVLLPAANGLGDPVLSGSDATQLVMMTVDYVPSLFQITVRGLRYVFESASEVQWYDDGRRAIDQRTGNAGMDLVRVLSVNEDRNDPLGKALRRIYDIAITRLYVYPDGTPEPRRTVLTFADENEDGFADNPDFWYQVCSQTETENYLFWQNDGADPFAVAYQGVYAYQLDVDLQSATPPIGTVGFQVQSATPALEQTFWVYGSTGWVQDFNQIYSFGRGRGPNVALLWHDASNTATVPFGDAIYFNWKHYATSDHRIDPCPTNLHDIFVLTYEYDAAIRQWIKNGADTTQQPLPPTELDLRLAFETLESYRMFSDGIIWRPVRYKLLFGAAADPELQAQFKVVPIPNAPLSTGEIQSAIIAAINTYFAVSNWDFGETFYYTEMAAYIHQQLAGNIGSIVIVPSLAASGFGDGFEVSSRPDEIFVSVAQVSDIQIIASNTPSALRIR